MNQLEAIKKAIDALDIAFEYVNDAINEYGSISYHNTARLEAMKQDLSIISDCILYLNVMNSHLSKGQE